MFCHFSRLKKSIASISKFLKMSTETRPEAWSNNPIQYTHCYSDGEYIYSVYLMVRYIQLFKPNVQIYDTSVLFPHLAEKYWNCGLYNISPIEVLGDTNRSLYHTHHFEKIKKCDMKYPIIIDQNKYIVDGMHRLAKAYMNQDKNISTYVFDNALLRKFRIGRVNDIRCAQKMTKHTLERIFYRRFLKRSD